MLFLKRIGILSSNNFYIKLFLNFKLTRQTKKRKLLLIQKELNTTNLVATFIDISLTIEKHSQGMLKIINYNI